MKPIEAIISSLRVAMTDARQNESHFESWMILNEAICDAIDALAKQPAEQHEPVAWQYSFTHSSAIGHGDYDIGPVVTDKKDVAFGVGCFGQLPLYTSPSTSKPWVGLVHEETHEAIGTAGVDLLELAKMWSDNKIHVYQFDNEARKIIEAVLRRASAKLREKNELV